MVKRNGYPLAMSESPLVQSSLEIQGIWGLSQGILIKKPIRLWDSLSQGIGFEKIVLKVNVKQVASDAG